MSASDSDDDIQLSSGALSALQEFLKESQAQQERFEKLKAKAEERFDDVQEATAAADQKEDEDQVTMDLFKEDWQLSQFWYDDETSTALAQEILDNTDENSIVACISAPTAYVTLMTMKPPKKSNLYLFEYDTRFDVYGRQFIHYDYSNPSQFRMAQELAGKVDYIVVDPPFLSEECCDKTLSTVNMLLKPKTGKVLMCTGLVMRDRVQLNIGAKMTNFYPKHKGGLANDFRSYTNYESARMPWEV